MNREELAWAAGFFDGEGCFRLHTGKYAQIIVNQVHPEVLQRFHHAVHSLGILTGPYTPAGMNSDGSPRRAMWTYRVTNWVGVQAVYAMLYPFLGSVKCEQGANVLRKAARGHASGKCGRGHLRTPENTTKWGQCRSCLRITDARRR